MYNYNKCHVIFQVHAQSEHTPIKNHLGNESFTTARMVLRKDASKAASNPAL